MSVQGERWVQHTQAYLRGVDPALPAVFLRALMAADYPQVSPAEALEAICADFLSGPSLRSEKPTMIEDLANRLQWRAYCSCGRTTADGCTAGYCGLRPLDGEALKRAQDYLSTQLWGSAEPKATVPDA